MQLFSEFFVEYLVARNHEGSSLDWKDHFLQKQIQEQERH